MKGFYRMIKDKRRLKSYIKTLKATLELRRDGKSSSLACPLCITYRCDGNSNQSIRERYRCPLEYRPLLDVFKVAKSIDGCFAVVQQECENRGINYLEFSGDNDLIIEMLEKTIIPFFEENLKNIEKDS